jgi:hypothetical protein
VRQELLDPLKGNARYEAAAKLVRRIYGLIDAGKDCSEALARLCHVTRREVSRLEMEDAAELIEPEAYAYELVAELVPVPTDLGYDEMLEALERILANEDDALKLGYWTRCLESNTGDKRISTLIQSPELYFGNPSRSRRLSAQEILDTALAAGREGRGEAGLTNG